MFQRSRFPWHFVDLPKFISKIDLQKQEVSGFCREYVLIPCKGRNKELYWETSTPGSGSPGLRNQGFGRRYELHKSLELDCLR